MHQKSNIFITTLFLISLISPGLGIMVSPLKINPVGQTELFITSTTGGESVIKGEGIIVTPALIPAGNRVPVTITVSPEAKGSITFIEGTSSTATNSVGVRSGVRLLVNGGETGNATVNANTPTTEIQQPKGQEAAEVPEAYNWTLIRILVVVVIGGIVFYLLLVRKYN